jgi:hypothetical protein
MEIDAHLFIFSVAAGVILVLMLYDLFNEFVRSTVRDVLSEQFHDLLVASVTASPVKAIVEKEKEVVEKKP